ncbi:response regulator transcription factor [Aestuariirhabdus sp. Z084]|uniref:response regulator transcription factor n=1 Tax=Aestuariirhabdus haliotis TaxID=2918751 RepID=UPI00201B371A|nr:response regulator transcription factor [Aestuariirhabdus haliotis]MCL6417641.1 response regulator transcription factor [Aestuariirhabdus haliotis]MCL6421567.1 response regulator transcription factor [Aestuariirhabdus haliotis]
MMSSYKIIVADDHPLFRTALQQAVNQAVEEVNLLEAESIESLQQVLETHGDADLVLLDLHMPGAHGYSGLIYLRGQYPQIPVVMVSATEDVSVINQAIEYGASGFIPKSSSQQTIATALQAVLDGDVWQPESSIGAAANNEASLDLAERIASLTPQQFKVLGMLTEGMLNKQIAYDLNVSEATIKAHATAIFKKLNVRNRTQAVIAVQQLEIEPPQLDNSNG